MTTLYFALWFGVLMLLKRLLLAQYEIEFRGLSLALFGALVVAKVVLLMEHVPLGRWTRTWPTAADVILRTVIYTIGVFVVLLLEKSFEVRHEYGGFGPALAHVFHHRAITHVWANTICVGWALLVFNALTVLREYVGDDKLLRLYVSPRSSGRCTGRGSRPHRRYLWSL